MYSNVVTLKNTMGITTDYLATEGAIKLICPDYIGANDLQIALNRLADFLNNSTAPLYVIVDLSNDPTFSTQAVIDAALDSLYRHSQVREWLLIGQSELGRMVVNVVKTATGVDRVRWFDSEADALEYIRSKK
jgi:hypothetical protein